MMAFDIAPSRDRVQIDPATEVRLAYSARSRPVPDIALRMHVHPREIHRALAGETVTLESAHRIETFYSKR